MFERWGHIVYRFRWPVLGLSIIMLLASLFAFTKAGAFAESSPSNLESSQAQRLIQNELPHPAGSSFELIFSNSSMVARNPNFSSAMLSALNPLTAKSDVTKITTPYDVASPDAAAALVSKDGHRALAIVSLTGDSSAAKKAYPGLVSLVHSDQLHVLPVGGLAVNHDFNVYLPADLSRASRISLPIVLILLIVVFTTVVAALLPLGVGGLAVIGGLSAVGILARVTDVSQYSTDMISLIGLGVAIDYSLFIVNRFREELRGGRSIDDALAISMATSGRAVTISGITVAVGLSALLFFQGSNLASIGLGGAMVVGIAVLYALTFLASLLAILGPRINKLTVLGRRPKPAGRGVWHRIASAVMRRPVMILVPVLALLFLVASPFLQLRLAAGGVSMLPPQSLSKQGYETLTQQFPLQSSDIAAVVRYAGDTPLTGDRVAALADYVNRLEQIPNVSTVVRAGAGHDIVLLSVATSQAPKSDGARAIVHAIRATTPPTSGHVLVTGETAADIDFLDFVLQRAPWAMLYVLVVTYVVLFMLVGSVLLPLKAVVMNIVSMATSFGALVWIFQLGHFSSLLNFTPASIDPIIPVLLFSIMFGLSMDYEVLLLSRIQEEYRRTGDTRHAIAEGLERSGRLITGAAAIMVVVFAGFALADTVLIKSIGFGLMIAVLVDATLVRALVVPALMRLLGRASWWAPKPLAWLYSRISLGEASAEAPDLVAEAA
jgi:putative drug exporter of the RND superfamily